MGEIFDLAGKITPITAAVKMNLHTLVKRGLSWDDVIPDDLRSVCVCFTFLDKAGNL